MTLKPYATYFDTAERGSCADSAGLSGPNGAPRCQLGRKLPWRAGRPLKLPATRTPRTATIPAYTLSVPPSVVGVLTR